MYNTLQCSLFIAYNVCDCVDCITYIEYRLVGANPIYKIRATVIKFNIQYIIIHNILLLICGRFHTNKITRRKQSNINETHMPDVEM